MTVLFAMNLRLGLQLALALGPRLDPSAQPVEAPRRPHLQVEVDPCLDLDPAAFREIIEDQLGWYSVVYVDGDPAPALEAVTTLLEVGCEGREAQLTVHDPLTAATTTRVVARSSTRGLERLAWTAADFVRGTWSTLALDRDLNRDRAEDPGASLPRARVRRAATKVARRPPVPWHLGDGFVMRSFLGADTPALMLGEQVEVVHRPTRHFAWKADGELSAFGVERRVDGVDGVVRTFTVSVAPALLSYAEWRGRGRRGAGTVAVYGGAGLRVGGVRMRSESFGSSGGYVPFLGPLAMARVSVATGRFVGLAVNAEAGWLLLGPERPGGVPLSFVGPWVNGVLVLVSSF